MKSKRIAFIVVLSIVGLLVILFALRFATLRTQTAARSIDEIQAAEGIPVDVQQVRKGTITRYVEILGTVQGAEQVDITSSLPIDITGIAKREGDRVRRGDVIIRLARDRQGKAYHQYAMAKQALENAENDLERMENLHKEGAVSGQALEQAQLAYRNAKSQFDQAASVVDLVSPIEGVVTMISATVGSAAVPGIPLATVASIDKMRIRCFVGHEEVTQLAVGQRAFVETSTTGRTRVNADLDPQGGTEGEVTRVSLSSDPETMLFLVEITTDNPEGKLRPGVVASVSVLIDERTDIVTVPMDALIERNGESYVYRISSNRARLTAVTTGTSNDEHVEVLGGVAEGDTIVYRGQYRLTDDALVNIHRIERTD
ncbi:MAG: efflux RND transporter periplasmic adaptor subunit [Candidatus Latescibacterota bacterium]|nr:MAG: efflux RND transporter periplasmic adaptor subunit [Candidatus Latescibacterota bacterium]